MPQQSITKICLKITCLKLHSNFPGANELTHWGRATHICVNKLTTIGPDNGLSPGRRQAIIWTIAGILLIGPLGKNFSEILIGIQTFSFKKMQLKMSSICLGLNELKQPGPRCPGALWAMSCLNYMGWGLQDGFEEPPVTLHVIIIVLKTQHFKGVIMLLPKAFLFHFYPQIWLWVK